MKKGLLAFVITGCIVSIGAAALADYTVTTQELLPPNVYSPYNVPCYGYPQNVNQGYYVNQNQQVQYNPYNYRNPYGYRNYGYIPPQISQLPYSTTDTTTTTANGIKNQIIRNIGQNILYSKLGGY